MTIDLSKFLYKDVLIGFRDGTRKEVKIKKVMEGAYPFYYQEQSLIFYYNQSGHYWHHPSGPYDIVDIIEKHQPKLMTIDLSKFVNMEVTVTFMNGTKETGIVEELDMSLSEHPYGVCGAFYYREGNRHLDGDDEHDIVHIELAEEKKVKTSLTESSINAISKVIANHLRDEVHDMVANKIRSEFNNEISESLVYKIAIEAIKKL